MAVASYCVLTYDYAVSLVSCMWLWACMYKNWSLLCHLYRGLRLDTDQPAVDWCSLCYNNAQNPEVVAFTYTFNPTTWMLGTLVLCKLVFFLTKVSIQSNNKHCVYMCCTNCSHSNEHTQPLQSIIIIYSLQVTIVRFTNNYDNVM